MDNHGEILQQFAEEIKKKEKEPEPCEVAEIPIRWRRLVSTAADYMRFCLMLSGKGALDRKRLLRAGTVEMMTRNQLPEHLIPITRGPAGRGFGLGFAVRVHKIDSEPSSVREYEWYGGAGTEFR